MIQYLTNVELNGKCFDSYLNMGMLSDNQNYDLTITLRIFLNKIIPAGGAEYVDSNGTRFRIGTWPIDEWDDFCAAFQYYGGTWWDSRFWLVAPGEMSLRLDPEGIWNSDGNRIHRNLWRLASCPEISPNINCRFNLVRVSSRASAHSSVNIRYFSHVFSNGAWIPMHSTQATGARPSSEDLDQDDIFGTSRVYEGVILRNLTIAHEIGHLIGLQHSGIVRREEACLAEIRRSGPAGGNHDLCYGSTLESRRDIMGSGESLSWYDALPWRTAIEQHTGVNKHLWEIRQTVIQGEYDPIRQSQTI
jgi:hypothetical protein